MKNIDSEKTHCYGKQENLFTDEIIKILDNVRYWDTCPDDYKTIINNYFNDNFNKITDEN